MRMTGRAMEKKTVKSWSKLLVFVCYWDLNGVFLSHKFTSRWFLLFESAIMPNRGQKFYIYAKWLKLGNGERRHQVAKQVIGICGFTGN